MPDILRNHFDVEVCRRKLAEHYKRTATVPTCVWSKKSAVNIHEIYTRLSWVKEEQSPAGSSRAVLNHYTDVLTENKNGLPSNRILVQGETGIGKSTFVKKLAMDWAEYDENRLTDEQRAILKKFELAVIIDLKKVSKHKSFRDIISASHIFADEDTAMKDGLLSYITHNQDKVLLVFDGYDEYHFGSNSEIFEIFKGNKLRNCCVLITTRISKADELKEFKDVHAEITGFSGEDSHSFMVRMLGDKIQAIALYRHLCKRNLNDLSRVPLLLLFFCTLWKKGSAQSFPDSKTTLYFEIVQYVLNHNAAKCSPANFRKVEDFKEILAEIGKVALECLMKDDHVFEYDQLPPAIRIPEESRIRGLLQVSEYSENLRPAGMVSFIHKSIQEFLAAWYINYRCVPEGNLGEINDRTRTLDDFRSLENVFQFVCGLSDDGAVKVFEHLKSVRISDSELDLSKMIPDGTDEPLCDITWKRQCFITLVNSSFGEVQTKTEVLRHYFNCTDGIIFVEGGSVREIIPERRILNGITVNGVVWFENKSVRQKATKINESIEFLDCLDVPLRMTENSVVVAVGEFLRKFEAIRCTSCDFTCILHYHNGQVFFYITRLRLHCNDHAALFDVTNLTSTPSHSTSSSSERFCLKYLSYLYFYKNVNKRSMKCLVTTFKDCKNLKNIVFPSVTKHTCELLQYVPNTRTCRVHLGHPLSFSLGELSLTSADVTKLAGLLPQFKNLASLKLYFNDCCAEAVNKLFSSITHKTLEELGLHGIILTPNTAAALGRSISEMSSLRHLSISGPERGFLETNEIEASPTGFDRTSLVSRLFTFNTGGCRFLPSLHTLRLERLNLNERGLRELLDNLKFFSELRFLSLYDNPLVDKDTVHSMVKKALPRVHVFY